MNTLTKPSTLQRRETGLTSDRYIVTTFVLPDEPRQTLGGIAFVAFSIASRPSPYSGSLYTDLERHMERVTSAGDIERFHEHGAYLNPPVSEVTARHLRFSAKRLQKQHDEFISRVMHPARLTAVIEWAKAQGETIA